MIFRRRVVTSQEREVFLHTIPAGVNFDVVELNTHDVSMKVLDSVDLDSVSRYLVERCAATHFDRDLLALLGWRIVLA